MPTNEEFEENVKALQEALERKREREVRPWDLLNPKEGRVHPDEKARRLAICKGCEFFRESSKTCSKCGCFMSLKTTLSRASCPVHKW